MLEFDKKNCTQNAYFLQKIDFCIFEPKNREVIENSSKPPLNFSPLQCTYLGKNSFLFGIKLHLHTCFEYASSECSDTQARMSLGCSSKISCAVFVLEEFVISLRIPSKHVNRATIDHQAKRHPNGVSLAGR